MAGVSMAETVPAVREPVARSPIATPPPGVVESGWAVSGRRSSSGLTLTDCMPVAKMTVKAPWNGTMAERLAVRFGRAGRQRWDIGGERALVLLVGAGPGEWLVLAPPGAQRAVASELNAMSALDDELMSVIDVTHGRALLRVSGRRSRDVLAKECGVDLTDAMCPEGAALRTAVARIATDLIRDDREGDDGQITPSYLLHCERSSGQYLFDALMDAGLEFGLDVDGFIPPGI